MRGAKREFVCTESKSAAIVIRNRIQARARAFLAKIKYTKLLTTKV